jgi:UDP-glucose 4-epimerase
MIAGLSAKAEGEVFNVGTGIETTVNTLAHAVLDLYRLDVKPLHIDRRDIDNIRRRVVNIEKVRRVLRWTPSVTLEDGLRLTRQWFEELTPAEQAGQMDRAD